MIENIIVVILFMIVFAATVWVFIIERGIGKKEDNLKIDFPENIKAEKED